MSPDLRLIESAFGLPERSVRAVERRVNGDYVLVLDVRRIDWAACRRPDRWAQLRPLSGRRVLRIPRHVIQHRHGQRGGRKWRGRNQRLWWWALWALPQCNAADPLRLERGDRLLDEVKAAIGREAHRSGARVLVHVSGEQAA